ncbi:NAD(P)/FAD-dependent oxidoreductase [Vulcanisaeta sp. JCM 16159]|uniref:NAD(P)-binding protein n=1 Tax=Vulcanisaeta sp. JCM 16159 TaxID=1295371 RepID=UPI000B200E6C
MIYDVAIVGGGPAGLFAAYEIVENARDVSVLLIDKGYMLGRDIAPWPGLGSACACRAT